MKKLGNTIIHEPTTRNLLLTAFTLYKTKEHTDK